MTRSLPLLALCLLSLPALAQRADPVDDASPVGYEVSLHGALAIERGSALQVTGVAYEVQGLAALRPTPGLAIEAAVVERTPTETSRVVVQAQAQSGAGGRFEVSLPMPRRGVASPRLELRVHRRGQPARRFEWPLVERAPETLDLLTDRQRYQPGEHVRVWVRVRNVRSEVPSSDASVRLELADPDGRVAAEHSGTTRASGVISAELVIPAQSVTGSWTVRARVEGEPPGPTAERSIEVLRRTVERLLARVELAGGDDDHDAVVVPGQLLRGRVVVTTPSGTPIPNAQVELRVREDAPIEPLRTDAGGIATFASRAPSFLSGEVGHEQVLARIVHPAYGSVLASAPYLLVRVRALASATPESGALVPEVPSILYVAITDPRGRPLPAGTVIEARGRGVRGGRFSGPIDVEGQLEVPMLVPRGAASRAVSGTCAGSIATAVELEIRTDPPVISRLCAFVAGDAEVLPRLAGPNVVPAGSRVTVTLARRPSARGRAVLVEGLFEGRAVAAAWAEGAQTQVDLTLPGDVVGVVSLRARPVQTPDARAPLSERGAALLGRGASTAVLTRPADVFSLEVRPTQPRWRVRERARVDLRASRAPSAGWVALLARDEAAHGGEEPWELRWLRRELHDAIRELAASSAPSEAHARLVQVALHAGLSAEAEMPSPPPLDPAYWDPRPHPYYDPSLSIAFGVLRDPIAMRELYLRQQLGQVEMALERAVEGLGADPRERAPIVSSGARVAFHPDVVAHLVRSHRLSDSLARTLGGQPIRADMIQAFDGAFTFDAVAKRVARRRLARLMQAVLRITDPDDPEAQRVSASLPPERWLSTLVQLGVVRQGDLLDPWGRPFVLRATPSPRLVLSDRATGYELASPGPDGRPGTGDDVRDPFARVVPEGSLYAIASGEDALMRRLAAASPATAVLSQLSGAYARLALAAQEEQRASVVDASTTEEADEVTARAMPATAAPPPAPEPAMMPGGGAGYRRRAMEQEAAAAADEDAEGRLDAQFAQRMPAAQSVAAAARAESLAAIVREDFPATLFFAGEVPLDGAEAHVEVPLADALTTYHLEAIAWTSSGWTTSARARISVDQDAMVDAPIPPELTAGDHARVPVRVENRTDAAFRVRASASTEGELALEIAPIAVLEVPAHDAVEALVEVHARATGSGTVLLQIATEDGRPLDAVRRPLTVLADARIARDERELL
ncbi:MAG: hypothetical protein IT378_17545, partial [Sandaracinaceae bacterium]|nr:hypothetical protein [Sandaracinaceae bacterium]